MRPRSHHLDWCTLVHLTFHRYVPSLNPRQWAFWIPILLPFPIAIPLALWVTHGKGPESPGSLTARHP